MKNQLLDTQNTTAPLITQPEVHELGYISQSFGERLISQGFGPLKTPEAFQVAI